MEANELIADPLVVKALKVRIETLCIANKQLREDIEALEDKVKLWSSERIKELENTKT